MDINGEAQLLNHLKKLTNADTQAQLMANGH